jgi:hypothetical protein
MSTYLSRDTILSVEDYKTDEVEVPEWGGTVRIRELNAAEVEHMGFGVAGPDGKMDLRRAEGLTSKVVAWGVIDEGGNQVFAEGDIKALGQKSHRAINLVAGEIMKLTGLSVEEEEVKNG